MSTELNATSPSDIETKEQNEIDILTDKVNLLFKYRDHYFEKYPTADAKCVLTQEVTLTSGTVNPDHSSISHARIGGHMLSQEVLAIVILRRQKKQKHQNAQQVSRVMYYYLKGKALNVGPQHSPQAEAALSKAVKLDPTLVEAWNELGDCYWKRDEIKEAKNCFMGALGHRKNKVSLRNLSMLLRQERAKSSEERVKNIEQGVSFAKEAVQLDTNDGISWSVLGNAYLSSFFMIGQDPKTLRLCMSAYLQALLLYFPDISSVGQALKFEEEYLKALESFSKAQSLDPTWPPPQQKQAELLKYLDNVQDLVRSKGKLKVKKLQQMIQSLDVKQLGPYQGGRYTSAGSSISLTLVPIAGLQPGTNSEKVVLGKVVCSVQDEDSVPFTFCMLDKAETCVAVTVYNLAQGKGVIIGDTVAIPEPYLSQVRFKYKDKEYQLDCIRVESPLVLVVNGKKQGMDKLANICLSSIKRSH
uniref:Tetratricopeptide repeat protein 5 OB fold domain-containing protein n=1 Tax=Timema genevievae TaxID=629358 RepID=A0A7R9K8M1_TIMGE|nr:unnamed protein product [Timema genevievae]